MIVLQGFDSQTHGASCNILVLLFGHRNLYSSLLIFNTCNVITFRVTTFDTILLSSLFLFDFKNKEKTPESVEEHPQFSPTQYPPFPQLDTIMNPLVLHKCLHASSFVDYHKQSINYCIYSLLNWKDCYSKK